MNTTSEGLFAAWPTLFSVNIAMGLLLVLAYGAIRSSVSFERREVDSLLIGIVFAAGAAISMMHPLRTAGGLAIDARTVFVLVGSLFGGPLGAAVVALVSTVYRLALGGPGLAPGIVVILASAAVGILFHRRYGQRVRDLSFLELLAIGLVNTVVTIVLARLAAALSGAGEIPIAISLSSLVIFPLGTVLLALVLSMAHYRSWWRAQQRLADIAETTSDLIWETDAESRFTAVSGRYPEVLGRPLTEIVGRTPDELGLVWADEATRKAYAEAREQRKPFTNLIVKVPLKDGNTRIISNSGRPAFSARGRFTGYRGTATDITERRRIERDLERARAHLARAQRVGKTASGEIDLRTGRLYWSDELFRLLGLEARSNEASVEHFFAAVHPDDRERIREQTMLNRDGVDTPDSEFRMLRPDGEVRWMVRSSEVTRDAGGAPQTVFTNFLDITERKHTEEELDRNRQHLERVQNVARIASTEVDLDTHQVHWSDEVYGLLGIDRDAVEPGITSFASAVHPEDSRQVRDASLKGRNGEEVEPLEFRVIGRDGQVRWFYRKADFVRDADGRPRRLIATMYDITERKTAEMALRDSEQRFAAIFRDSPAGIAITDLSGDRRFVDTNLAWLTTLGYERDEVIGRTGLDLNIWPETEARAAIYKGISAPAGFWTGETQFRRKDGTVIDIALTMRRVDIGGRPYAVAISYEITDRKRAERALLEAHAKLEARVLERTKELAEANRRLVESSQELDAARSRAEEEKERAEAANMAKSDFLARVSHELRTPLNAVLGFAQLLEINNKEPLTIRQMRHVEQIRKSGHHLLSLIEEILDLSKIETGSIRVSIERVALAPVFDHLRATLQPLADSAGLLLAVEMPLNLPPVYADRVRLVQILMNLGTNAIKYNRRGGAVRLVARVPGDGTVRIEVIDTGKGIPFERQGEVFQPFNRLGAEESTIEGSGIGLSISHRLAELMNGRLTFVSAPGKGSTFTIDLPVAPAAADEPAETGRAGVVESALPRAMRDAERFTLLYVEDNPPNIALMQELVDSVPSLRLVTAADANTGLALAHAHEPDVIVLDINLPGMNGFEILKRLKLDRRTAEIPVMALSAAALPNDVERGKAAGFTHYLTKPLDVQEFLGAVEQLLNARPRAMDESRDGRRRGEYQI